MRDTTAREMRSSVLDWQWGRRLNFGMLGRALARLGSIGGEQKARFSAFDKRQWSGW